VKIRQLELGGRRIDYISNCRDAIGREAAEFGVLADECVIWRAIDAVDLVAGHVALNPLDLVAEFGKHPAGSLGNVAKLIAC